jgi:hypothetical protein
MRGAGNLDYADARYFPDNVIWIVNSLNVMIETYDLIEQGLTDYEIYAAYSVNHSGGTGIVRGRLSSGGISSTLGPEVDPKSGVAEAGKFMARAFTEIANRNVKSGSDNVRGLFSLLKNGGYLTPKSYENFANKVVNNNDTFASDNWQYAWKSVFGEDKTDDEIRAIVEEKYVKTLSELTGYPPEVYGHTSENGENDSGSANANRVFVYFLAGERTDGKPNLHGINGQSIGHSFSTLQGDIYYAQIMANLVAGVDIASPSSYRTSVFNGRTASGEVDQAFVNGLTWDGSEVLTQSTQAWLDSKKVNERITLSQGELIKFLTGYIGRYEYGNFSGSSEIYPEDGESLNCSQFVAHVEKILNGFDEGSLSGVNADEIARDAGDNDNYYSVWTADDVTRGEDVSAAEWIEFSRYVRVGDIVASGKSQTQSSGHTAIYIGKGMIGSVDCHLFIDSNGGNRAKETAVVGIPITGRALPREGGNVVFGGNVVKVAGWEKGDNYVKAIIRRKASFGYVVKGVGNPILIRNGELVHPLDEANYTVTSKYGNRTHPISGNPDFHHGVDFAASAGTPVYAAMSGEVVSVVADGIGDGESFGNYVRIWHESLQVYTVYAHLLNLSELHVGDVVDVGAVVGEVGSTGSSSGNHLHFEICFSGTGVNGRNSVNPELSDWLGGL